MNTQTPVLLLTGYLGSGKTTLVNRILTNRRGIKFAVIVNDIGEVNIDADLIQKGGIVGQNDDSLVALQNGCICCTLKMDLVKQLTDIISQKRFDYIVIEASGICEPDPIAQTICSIPSMGGPYTKDGVPRLDCVVTVGINLLQGLAKTAVEREFVLAKLGLLDHARRKTTQKVNLFEKVQIPGYQEAIRKIKRFMEDEENLSKSSQKILKSLQEARKKGEEQDVSLEGKEAVAV